jgi:hypothetical protein
MKWLRKYDDAKERWTNQCYPYNKELATEKNFRLIDDAEKAECDKALAVEKRQIVEAARAKNVVPVALPPMNKAEAPKVKPEVKAEQEKPAADEPEVMTLADVEREAKADSAPVEQPAPVAADDLDAKSKVELQNLIDAEQLPVKKIGNKPELIYAIRAAREAKKAPAQE